ncbi:MAG: hypothetical protein ACM3PT_06795 [Deltaproteobacteria bacterium]
MQNIEPFFSWRDEYTAEDDPHSPFYHRIYDEFSYHNAIYNYYIHPQWDDFGSSTLYLKIIWVNYRQKFAILQLIGEWNDILYNDIMYLKRNIAEHLMSEGIVKFLLVIDNVLNFHGDDTSYYEEWCEEVLDENGWIVSINCLEHVRKEFRKCKIDRYINMDIELNDLEWRVMKPNIIFDHIENYFKNKLKSLH